MTSTPETDLNADAESPLETEPTAEGDALEPEALETPDAVLEPIDETVARELALAALREITAASTIGDPTDATVDSDGVLTLRFSNRMPGYPGWFWTVSLAQVPDAAPTVLEVELTPGEGALTAPDWLPWAERLAEYQAAQAALAAEGLATDDLGIVDDDEDDLDDIDDLDASDFDNDGSPILHSGDVDGVDIDELSDDAEDDDADEDDSDEEESDEEESDEDEDSDDSDDDEDESDEDESDQDDEDSEDDEDSDHDGPVS